MTTANFDAMGKAELRAACKAAGVAYGKLDNAGMRAALVKMQEKSAVKTVKVTPPAVVEVEVAGASASVPTADISSKNGTITLKINRPSKVEKNREENNGVKRPSAGTICRAIWDSLDKLRAKTSTVPTFEELRGLQALGGWQKNTAVTQYQRWKEFNGLMPRASK